MEAVAFPVSACPGSLLLVHHIGLSLDAQRGSSTMHSGVHTSSQAAGELLASQTVL